MTQYDYVSLGTCCQSHGQNMFNKQLDVSMSWEILPSASLTRQSDTGQDGCMSASEMLGYFVYTKCVMLVM